MYWNIILLCFEHVIWVLSSQELPLCSAGKESTCNAGNLGSVPEFGRSHAEGKDYPLQYFGLENSTDGRVYGVAKSLTQLNGFHFTTILRKLYVNSTVLAQHWYTRIFTCNFFSSDVLESLPDVWTSIKFFSSIGADPHQHPADFLNCSCE